MRSPLFLVALELTLLCSFHSLVDGDAITGLTVYSDSACTMNYTGDNSWQSWSSINASLIPSYYIGVYGPCITSPAASVSSGEFFCTTSTGSNNSNIYSLGAIEWTSSATCSPAGGYSIYYYFSGLQDRCARGMVNISGTTTTVYATYSCTPTGNNKNAAAVTASSLAACTLLTILAVLAMLQ